MSGRMICIILFAFILMPLHALTISKGSPKIQPADSISVLPYRPFKTALFVIGTNLGVWSFDRYVMKAPYSVINLSTINNNLKTGFVWDNDLFETNLFFHPYHGGLYFNAARSGGLGFWQSVPITGAGSLMWESLLENEPPAINDFLTTTIGGTCLGEINFRLSDLLIDDRTVGLERFERELLLTLISPVRGVNRLITGESFRHRNIRGNNVTRPPVSLFTSTGYRRLSDKFDDTRDVNNMFFVDMNLYYGNPFDPDNEKPYDFFSLKAGFNLFSNQRLISHVNVLGLLFSKSFHIRKPETQLVTGIFQHFNFYQANEEGNNSMAPYKISEAASPGIGLMLRSNPVGNISLSGAIHASAILLGGSQTDYYKYEKRDYNMGSGFGTKANGALEIGSLLKVAVSLEDYRIYSWLGYNGNNDGQVSTNVQGDKGRTSLSVANLKASLHFSRHYFVTAETSYYYRKSDYFYHPAVIHRTNENKIGIGYYL